MKFGKKVGVRGLYEENGILRNVEDWSAVSKYSIGFGQEISMPPLQLLTFYLMIARNGNYLKPYIIKGYEKNGKKVKIAPKSEKLLSTETAVYLKKLMRRVVTEGTGSKAKSNIIDIAGKTGTGQIFDQKKQKYSPINYVASFVGFYPYNNPEVVMLVLYNSPKKSVYGGSTAAETFKEIAEYTIPFMGIDKKNN